MAFNTMNDSYQKANAHFTKPIHNIRLVYIRENQVGAKLYLDSSNAFVVKLEHAPTMPEPYVMVRFQED